jgi:hypothetical protein
VQMLDSTTARAHVSAAGAKDLMRVDGSRAGKLRLRHFSRRSPHVGSSHPDPSCRPLRG